MKTPPSRLASIRHVGHVTWRKWRHEVSTWRVSPCRWIPVTQFLEGGAHVEIFRKLVTMLICLSTLRTKPLIKIICPYRKCMLRPIFSSTCINFPEALNVTDINITVMPVLFRPITYTRDGASRCRWSRSIVDFVRVTGYPNVLWRHFCRNILRDNYNKDMARNETLFQNVYCKRISCQSLIL